MGGVALYGQFSNEIKIKILKNRVKVNEILVLLRFLNFSNS